MNTWIAGKNLMKHHYQIKKAFYSKLNLEDITHKDYDHAEKVFEESKLKKPGAYVFQMICLYLSLVCLSMASLFKKD